MTEPDDQQLLRDFAEDHSEAAFATLAARHVNLVCSTALRFAANPHLAEEITQAVFIILARKAGKLSPRVVLSGWLYQTARWTAANAVKSEIRRQRREQDAYMQSNLNESDAPAWEQIGPLLDNAMGQLSETDRNAVLLSFFENKTAREVAAALQLTEAAAHKRVNRALEKLRKFFAKRGVSSTTAIIAGAISANSVQAAPVGLAKTISAVSAAKGAMASTSTLTLIKGALKIMAWTKVKTAVVAGVAVILVAGTTGLVIKHQRQTHNSMPMAGVGSGQSSQQGLQGHWTGSNTAHPGETCTLNIVGNQFEYRGAEPNDWVRGTFVVNERAKPNQLDVTIAEPASESGKMISLIYQSAGHSITLAAGPHGSGQRPVDFTPGSQVDVLELQRD